MKELSIIAANKKTGYGSAKESYFVMTVGVVFI